MASAMMAISNDLMKRITRALSNLSASWPLVADSRTNGRMNTALMTRPAFSGGSHVTFSWYVTSTVNANFRTLSLPAPKNCVQKNGAKRRWRSSANWLGWDWLIAVLFFHARRRAPVAPL